MSASAKPATEINLSQSILKFRFNHPKLFFLSISALIVLILFVLGNALYHQYNYLHSAQYQISHDKYLGFVNESFDSIQQNHWLKLSDEQLVSHFQYSADGYKKSSSSATLSTKDDLIKYLAKKMQPMDEQKKEQFIVTMVNDALNRLPPFGKSRLFTEKQEVQLKNIVSNINPDKDLYKSLDIEKHASSAAVEQAYQQKAQELKKDTSPEGQQKLQDLTYAHDVLSDPQKKQRYDTKGAEPTVFNIKQNGVAYIKLLKFSPDTYTEFEATVNKIEKDPTLKYLVIDLRSNIGGAIDLLPYFIGDFIGQNQFAYSFLHQDNYQPYLTLTPKSMSLVKFQKVVALTDGKTQSTGELMASALKKSHSALLLGERTNGWGTVEKVFPLETRIDDKQKFSLFVVHSLTVRFDGDVIEGNGVSPDINIHDAHWKEQLSTYSGDQNLTTFIESLVASR